LENTSDVSQTQTADVEEYPAALSWIIARAPILHWPLHFGWRIAMRWGEDQCPLKAAAMAFFGFLSVFPIILAGVSILATVLAGNTAALEGFQSFVTQFFPGQAGENISAATRNAVTNIAGSANTTTVSLIALVSLLWSGRAFFATLAEVLTGIWPRSKPRTFWRSQLALWSTFIGAGFLWLLSTLATFALTFVVRVLQFLPAGFRNALPWFDIGSRVSSWLLTVFMFWLIYRFLPNVEGTRRRRIVWGGAVLAAFLWEVAKWGFARFLGNLDRYQPTYGSVAGVVVTLMWIYVSSTIILLGAEVAAAYEETCAALPGSVCPSPAAAADETAPGETAATDNVA
jgi:membrane protein